MVRRAGPHVDPTSSAPSPAPQPPIAGIASSSVPTMSADGHLIAFITKATNLQLVQAAGGGEVSDGDLLVADASTGRTDPPQPCRATASVRRSPLMPART